MCIVDRSNGRSLQYLYFPFNRHQRQTRCSSTPRQNNVTKNSFSGAVLWNSLPIDQRQAKSLWVLGLAANNSSGGLHGTYVKQTKALSLIQFGDKHNGKVLEALILKQDYNSLIQESRKFVKITSKANGAKMRRGQD